MFVVKEVPVFNFILLIFASIVLRKEHVQPLLTLETVGFPECLLVLDSSCVHTSKVSMPHIARPAVFVDRFLWDYNGKPLFKDRY